MTVGMGPAAVRPLLLLPLMLGIGLWLPSPGTGRSEAKDVSAKRQAWERIVVDFSQADEAQRWVVVNDGVMGGLSRSRISITKDATAVFQGQVSLENNGGFASVRRLAVDDGLADSTGLRLRVRGDGKTYQLRLRVDSDFDGIAYRAHFETQDSTWVEVELPFDVFVPSFRGRIVGDAPPLVPEQVRQIGFMIADKQAGSFRLEIDWLKAFCDVDSRPECP